MLVGRHFTYIWDIFSEQYNFLADSRGSMIIHFSYIKLRQNTEKSRQFGRKPKSVQIRLKSVALAPRHSRERIKDCKKNKIILRNCLRNT